MAKPWLPLLRSPPFPGVPVAVAAVSDGRDVGARPFDEARGEKALELVRAARVGGAFWAAQASSRGGTVARSGDRRLTREVPTTAFRIVRNDIARPGRQGRSREAIDPWSLLTPDSVLYAHGNDEWVAVAAVIGAQVRILSPGRFGDPGDAAPNLRRRIASHLLACRYRDPFSGVSCAMEDAVALLSLWRDRIAANRGIVAAAGMAWWKRAEIRRFLWSPRDRPLRFLPAGTAIRRAARYGGGVAIWPSRVAEDAILLAAERRVPLIRVEDGFVRSIGLGADLVPPLSIAVDRSGIHYDPAGSSDLERLIEAGAFPPALLDRAAALRARIVADRISKYGDAGHAIVLPARRPGCRLVLVPGQVEDDRSVLLGGGAVTGNLDLLRRTRRAEPDAEIWFRPHPDVDAGHRRGGLRDDEAMRYADRVVRAGSMPSVLGSVDAVHVLTSLTGFEALLRDREVVCHGMPFFAGWGLTRDLTEAPARRRRRASLDELVAATLILYPYYLDPVTGLPCPPEVLLARIAERRAVRPGLLVRLRRLQGLLRRRF